MKTSETPLYIYRVVTEPELLEAGSLCSFELCAGPYLDGRTVMRDAEALRQSQPGIYYSFIVTSYKGERWSYHLANRCFYYLPE